MSLRSIGQTMKNHQFIKIVNFIELYCLDPRKCFPNIFFNVAILLPCYNLTTEAIFIKVGDDVYNYILGTTGYLVS